MRLNLGCGPDIRSGYVNVDFRQLRGVDVVTDLSVFPWPFTDGSAEEILLLDFLEHFPYRMTQTILLECYRVLTPNGELVIQVPDGVQTACALAQVGKYLCNKCGAWAGSGPAWTCQCGQTLDDISEAAMGRLYGGQDYVGNYHQVCFTQRSLGNKALACGFTSAEMEEMDHQFKNWSLKVRLKKGDLW